MSKTSVDLNEPLAPIRFDLAMPEDVVENICNQMNELTLNGHTPQVIILWNAYIPGWRKVAKDFTGRMSLFNLPVYFVDYDCIKVY